jgi:hypothetical protein
MMGTLRWIFANFPNPNHIALTGCSAGGTSLPVVYDLLNKHYNKFGVRTTQVNTIIDFGVDYERINHEGFVMSNQYGAFKLVKRQKFSFYNFTLPKNW